MEIPFQMYIYSFPSVMCCTWQFSKKRSLSYHHPLASAAMAEPGLKAGHGGREAALELDLELR